MKAYCVFRAEQKVDLKKEKKECVISFECGNFNPGTKALNSEVLRAPFHFHKT